MGSSGNILVKVQNEKISKRCRVHTINSAGQFIGEGLGLTTI